MSANAKHFFYELDILREFLRVKDKHEENRWFNTFINEYNTLVARLNRNYERIKMMCDCLLLNNPKGVPPIANFCMQSLVNDYKRVELMKLLFQKINHTSLPPELSNKRPFPDRDVE